ncbi:hypothetical protein HMPREF3034_02356 [Prevotella sp. DNF00663]|nr:hypothetical protein [Prevotella sp. DNF00663]KXB78687.1 hypothetical protein HMPREF3034_02356 [Prevotella sp. DNF00663]
MASKNNNSEQNGHLYIGCPTLETLAFSCVNAKVAAHTSNIEYSNFLKACKMEKDIRLNTYRKCAAGLGKEVLIVHLPLGTIESMTKPKAHVKNQRMYLQPIITQYFIDNKSEIWLLFLIAHSKR